MNRFTLRFRDAALELQFWSSWSKPLVSCDAISAVWSAVAILVLNLNMIGLFDWQLTAASPAIFHIAVATIVVRVLQLVFIFKARQSYHKHRVLVNVVVRVLLALLMALNIRAGVAREDFLRPEWLGGADGRITSHSAIYKALLLPTGAITVLFDVVQQQVPFRYAVVLQMLVAALALPAGWLPVTKLIERHSILTEDAAWICQAVHDSVAVVTGIGSTWQPIQGAGCTPATSASRTVLITQLIFVVVVPLLVTYIFECEAKCAFQRRYTEQQQQQQRQQQQLQQQQEQQEEEEEGEAPAPPERSLKWQWSIYAAIALGSFVACDFIVVMIHRLGST